MLGGPWLIRLAWLVVPFAVGPAFSTALDATSDPVQTLVSVSAWTVWGLGLLATLVPRALSLTVVRVSAPGILAAAIWAAVRTGLSIGDLVAVAWATLTTIAALAPNTTDAFVDGSSYGPERRLALRVPGPLLLGPLELTWAALVAGVATGPLLIATGNRSVGGFVLIVGCPVAFAAARSIHSLSRRWVVFVPAGMVLHDPLTITDPVLFRSQIVRRLSAAVTGTDAPDLTMGSLGLALELELTQPVELTLVGDRRRAATSVAAEHLLFTPVRPGALLAEARERRLPVG